jgi:hypothetical protein
MADNNMEMTPSFSIEDTMEMGGMGSTELLKDLFGTETSTGDPNEVEAIVKEVPSDEPEAPKKAPASPKKEEAAPEKKNDDIKNFLYGGDDDDEEEEKPSEEKPSKSVSPEASEEESSSEENTSIFSTLSKELFKLNVFTNDEEEEETPISTPEEFLERFQTEKKKGAIEIVNNFIGQFGEDYQQAFQAIFVKGVNPKDYFGAYNNIQSFSELDLSQENNQVAVIRQALTDQGFESEDVETEIERLKNYGDLESVAAKHHKVLVKKEAVKLKQMEEEKESQLQQQAAFKQQYVQNVNTILQEKVKSREFDGIPVNPKLAGELQDFLLTDKYKLPSGELLTEFDRTILDLKRPENHNMKVKLALLLKIMEKDPTLSTIQKTGITKKSNELFGEVARQATKSSMKSSSNTSKPSSSWFL